MKVDDFLKAAREKISDDPLSRVGTITGMAIENPNCIFDIHSHIFDRRCLTVLYIALRMARNTIGELLGLEADDDLSNRIDLLKETDQSLYKKIAERLPETDEDWEKLEKEIDAIQELEKYELFGFKWKDLKRAIQVLKQDSMTSVLDLYLENYALNKLDRFKDKPIVVGVLMMDLEIGWGIKPKKKLIEQIIELKQLAKSKPVLPFLAVDPRRADLTDESENLYSLFLKAFTEVDVPFFGVKCYPSLGYFPSDKRLDPIFQICEEKNIPITTHCGGTIVSTYEKMIQIQDSNGLGDYKIPGDSRKERATFLNDPMHWEPVLNKHKKLKLNLAHFGGDSNWEDYSNNRSNQTINAIISMLSKKLSDQYQYVYTDFSFNVVEENLFDALIGAMDTKNDIAPKVMFGTDFWVVLPTGDLFKKQSKFLDIMDNHVEKMIKTNPRNFLFKKTY